ncbi:MAG: D-glycero-beta-D-manno-heptose 1-phosphate adenylyltransferase [Bacteroidales bacterium]|jgi:rfaE bifunctional protein nucleotidyltransferase chain/domain|nr:D-glycero-beta-D-manno-heptose 1-phosphate adenylyltransferase [Bacteroidales bacterium]
MTPIEHIKNKILTNENLLSTIQKWKDNAEKIVFTNGCFDILHQGHIDYLAKSKALGDRLIIGVNADTSISRIKGKCRPIQDEYSRLILLASMEFVDAVVLFFEDTPYNLIFTIQPDVLVKGADYTPSEIVGYDIITKNGGEVVTIPFLKGYSTTKIIEKILGK